MAQSDRNHSTERSDLLRLSLLSWDARRQGADRAGDRLLNTDSNFDAAQFSRDRVDRAKLLGLPRSRLGRHFPAGAAAWAPCASGGFGFFAGKGEKKNRAAPGRGGGANCKKKSAGGVSHLRGQHGSGCRRKRGV